MSWIVYILRCGDGSLYTGITNDVVRRIAAHEAGAGAKYTKGRGPFVLIYEEPCLNRSEASKRELMIKKLNKQQKQKLVMNGVNLKYI